MAAGLLLALVGAFGALRWRVERSVDLVEELERAPRSSSWVSVEAISIDGSRRRAVVPDRDRVFLRKVPVFDGAKLHFSFAVAEQVWQRPGDGVTFKVHAHFGNRRRLLYTRYVDPKSRPSDRRWIDVEIPLGERLRGAIDIPSTIDLRLSTESGFRGDDRHDAPLWADLRVQSTRWEWPSAQPARRPNVVLISLDTLRADRVGALLDGRSVTPRIDEIGRQGFRFQRAYAPANHTLLSHMSLLTGLYPKTHGVRRGKGRSALIGIEALQESRVTLAETLQAHGYTTGGFAFSCVWLDARFGFAEGFDRYTVRSQGAARTNDRDILPWLDANHRDPFFLFVHFYDAHSDWTKLPYDAPKEFRASQQGAYRGKFNGCGKGSCATVHLKKLDHNNTTVSAADLDYIRSLYDAGVAWTDHQVGRIIDRLEGLGVLDDTLVVITSDHGEEFREHGRFIHTQLYDEIARIPLVFRLPGSAKAGGASSEVVKLVDVMPTILDLVGVPPEDEVEGRSIRPLMQGQALEPVPVFLTSATALAVVDWPWKMVHFGNRSELYNLELDPLEKTDVLAARRSDAARLRAMLSRWKRSEGPEAATPGDRVIDADDADVERLRALGYID